MHIRVIVPEASSQSVVDFLQEEPSATNLIVMPGAAKDPVGDVVLVDIAREGLDTVLARLHRFEIHRHGSIAVEEVNFSFSDAAARAELAAPGLGEDSVVWNTVERRALDDSRMSISYFALMAVATMIAGIGVLLDQPILIVGAMVVGPDFGPLAALCVGIVRGKPVMIGRAAVAIITGFAFGILVTIGSTLALVALGIADDLQLFDDHPNLAFIWEPDGFSWAVGFLAGVAGVISLTTTKSSALVGVAISVTTIPAAAFVAAAIAYNIPSEAFGSLGQLGINIASIVIGGVLTLLVQTLWQRIFRRSTAK
jgi:uncharacterized hydrophobic protein (TIGR00271 family)